MIRTREQTVQRWLFGVAIALTLSTIASLPFALVSVLKSIRHPDHEEIPLTPPDLKPSASYSQIEIGLHSVNEVNHTVSLLVSGYHFSHEGRGSYADRLILYEADERDPSHDSMPPSASIEIPSSGAEFSTKITLPLRGSVLTYPFDVYHFGLGVLVERTLADGTVKILTPEETSGQLIITIDEQIARMEMTDMRIVPPASVRPKHAEHDYAYAALFNFDRPVYLKVVVTNVVLLTVAVAIYTMITRPFDQLVINAGAVILGVFGARSLVLSDFPADVTLVDTIFSLVVLYNLLALTVRGMNFFHRGGKLTILPWALPDPPAPETPTPALKECPECFNKVPAAARRCGFCTSVLV